MKARSSILSRLGWIIAAIAVLLIPAGAAFAQDYSQPAATGAGIVSMLIMFVFFAAFYVYFALGISTIAKKTNTPNAVWGWIPILNVILLLNIAKKPVWWIILFLIPLVSLVIAIIVWMAVAEARQKPSWWGIVALFIGPGMLAWVD